MRPSRKTKLAATLVAALACIPGLAVPVASAASTQTRPPPILQLAVLPRPTRVHRQPRSVTGRARSARRRLGDGRRRDRARGLNLRPRLPVRDSYARGPP
jgi:hypothetical protein